MYGYAPFNPAVAPRSSYAMQPYGAYAVYGADAPQKTLGEKISDGLETETIPGVKNKFTLAVALAAGLGYYGYRAGWFG